MKCDKCGEDVFFMHLHTVGLKDTVKMTKVGKMLYKKKFPTYADEPKREICEKCMGWE